MKWLLRLGIVVVVLVVAVYFVAAYFLGNLPVASKMLGTNKPRDLGVELSVDNTYDGLASLKHPVTTEELQAIVENPEIYTKVDAALTDEEASSMIATSKPTCTPTEPGFRWRGGSGLHAIGDEAVSVIP